MQKTYFPVLISSFSPISCRLHHINKLSMVDRSPMYRSTKNLHLVAWSIIRSLAISHRGWPNIRGTLFALCIHFYSVSKKRNTAFRRLQSWPHLRPLLSVLTVGFGQLHLSAAYSFYFPTMQWWVESPVWVLSPLLLTTIGQNDGQVKLLIWQKPSSETIFSWGSVHTWSLTQSRAFPSLYKEVFGTTVSITTRARPDNTVEFI